MQKIKRLYVREGSKRHTPPSRNLLLKDVISHLSNMETISDFLLGRCVYINTRFYASTLTEILAPPHISWDPGEVT